MKFFNSYCVIALVCGLFFNSCKKYSQNKEVIVKKEYLPQKNEVTVMMLKKQTFKKEIVSNGKLVAIQKVPLSFDVSEQLEKLYVKNGSKVKQGQVVAKLRNFSLQKAYDKAKTRLKKSTLDFQDKLIGRGYDTGHKDSIPAKEYEMIAIRSGYKDAQHEVESALFKLKSTKLIAPFSGKIANIQAKQYEYISAGKEVMTLINDTTFEVEFYLIESELADIHINSKIQIKPFAVNKTYDGYITTINPQIEKDGTILIKARVKNDKQLIEGMNVKVLIQKDIPNQFVVPKSSVVIRQNQEVLFTIKSGKTFWTYVNTTHENSRQYSVIPDPNKSSASLQVGDTIVTSGNLNLAHETEVAIKSTQSE